ncbi:PDR/VanB family oxidoreductase [Microbacterium sp. SORGH_AS_0888]|uniref:PDR/VanB family oxidoreductase n=1 Tax=Microbacterium sp. SORGH_AS_0888 TaxID=3041791 RepID=UPI0027892275|nr:PDR/VanB family oxidoreductase [Microbacterium sp. SORGH_AS_0888]MDQ1129661.1 ferredoxin-NADP reductase [Microbacterium sp. SORGH_AS_0888]
MLTLQVARRIEEADGVAGLILADPMGAELPAWRPGAHIDVVIDRPGRPALVRQYSLCGDPAERTQYRIAVLREPEGGGGSIRIHEGTRAGQLVRVSEPRELFGFSPAARMVFVAGGIGITPILPMIAAAEAAGADWALHYAGREPATMAFGAELEPYGAHVHVYASSAGERMALPAIVADAAGAVVYACGPGRLLDELERLCGEAGVELRVERFVNDNVVTMETDHPFEVELSLTGRTVTVAPGESILDKVAEAGASAPSSCRGGTCGTCETFVLEGEPDHRDAVLTAAEREESEVMMICVSRCKGDRLVLEL